ncbi:DivIVA domain-containing protein [Aurantimicrobium minutum]|uniref:DivIVA domain-containing protein n=1 Tax=Aurantimicrobium minutum TaxID=708131 RepID=UPI0024756E47|nr:DivIVA domain-containing protein [Aurantimicrobium minutum]MDH6422855.1 DivIVA domain-containing protein [Aurantimicrobium minutum]
MSFPRVKRGTRGYNTAEVDAFIAEARVAYDSNIAGATSLTSRAIRDTSFSLHKGGYSTRHVDGALERLETAFAERERAVALATIGEAALLEQASQSAAVLTARFSREPKHRFSRVGFLTQGYAVKDVDAFAERVNAYLLSGEPLSVADVRSVTFRAARGGYDEAQVDAVLDALIDLLLSLGNN